VAAAPAGAGEEQMSMTEEKTITEFTEKLRLAAGANLISVILYGSAADGEFHPEYSDLNLLCILRDSSYASLVTFNDAVDWWRKKKHRPPQFMSLQELKDSADVFSIEFLDMKQRHRVVYGEDVLQSLDIPMGMHRSQLEYELREKLLLLRQHVLVAANDEKQLWDVMLSSLSSFTTLFRHALMEMGEQSRKHSRDAVQELGKRLNFDLTVFVQLMDVRAKQTDRKQVHASELASRYLGAIEHVANIVDKMQSSSAKSIQ